MRNTSYTLKIYFPKSEKEFLNSKSRDRLIDIYQYTLETMKDAEIVESFGLEELGKCFDFVSKYSDKYKSSFADEGISFVDHLKTILAYEIQNKKYENSVSQANSHADDLRVRIDSIPVSEVQRQFAQEGANSFLRDMKQKEFDEKFPEYKKVKHILLMKENGFISSEQDKEISITMETMKKCYPDVSLELNDLLLPYLEEKAKMGILDDRREKELYSTKVRDDYDYCKKLIISAQAAGMLAGVLVRDNGHFDNKFDRCWEKFDAAYLLLSGNANAMSETLPVAKKKNIYYILQSSCQKNIVEKRKW